MRRYIRFTRLQLVISSYLEWRFLVFICTVHAYIAFKMLLPHFKNKDSNLTAWDTSSLPSTADVAWYSGQWVTLHNLLPGRCVSLIVHAHAQSMKKVAHIVATEPPCGELQSLYGNLQWMISQWQHALQVKTWMTAFFCHGVLLYVICRDGPPKKWQPR